jgi:hypothetical protein
MRNRLKSQIKNRSKTTENPSLIAVNFLILETENQQAKNRLYVQMGSFALS